MPMTRVGNPCRAQPAVSPAWVPPDDDACTIASGSDTGWAAARSILTTARANAAAPSGVDAPSGTSYGTRPSARSRARELVHRRRAVLARRHVVQFGAEQRVEQCVRAGRGGRRTIRDEHASHSSRAAVDAVARMWFDCTPPTVIRVSAPQARASAATRLSLRTLLPPKPKGMASSRLTKMRGAAGAERLAQPVRFVERGGTDAKSGSAGSAAEPRQRLGNGHRPAVAGTG